METTTKSTMETTTKSRRVEEFGAWPMGELLSNCMNGLEDATKKYLDLLCQGGEREIMFDQGFWFDPETARNYLGLRIDGGSCVWALWTGPDGEESKVCLSTWSPVPALQVLFQFTCKLFTLAWEREGCKF